MNLAIRECSRKGHDSKSSARKSSIPNFSCLAQDLGFNDSQDLKDEAENMWAMLTDLHESDPEGYRSFVESQMKAADEAQKNQRQFTPEKAFVVQTLFETSSLKGDFITEGSRTSMLPPSLVGYVNFCHHKALEIPKDPSDNKVDDSSTDFTNLKVPLVISDVRQIQWRDKAKEHPGAAIDVVFHPWCYAKWNGNESFKNQIIDLGMKAIEEDGKLKFGSFDWKILRSSDYKGGMGVNQNDVHPFPIEMSSQATGGSTGDDKSKNTTDDEENGPIPSTIIDDPSSLLQSLKSEINSEEETETPPLISITNNNQGKSKKVLIQEISSESFSKVKHQSEQKTLSFKKGFLSKRKGKLYEVEGSSGDGKCGKGGSFSKFVSKKCQVIDIKNEGSQGSTSPQISSGTGTTCNEEDIVSSMKAEENESTSDSLLVEVGDLSYKKGFLNGKKEEKQQRKGSNSKEKPNGLNANPLSTCESKSKKAQENLSLQALNILFDEANQAKTIKDRSSTSLPEEVNRIDAEDTVTEIPNQIITTQQGNKLVLDLSKTKVQAINDLELEVIDDKIKVKTDCGYSFHHSNPTSINPKNVTAKFQKRIKRLTIAF